MFQKIWKRYKTRLIPDSSPKSSFLTLPQFQQALLVADFDHWKRAGFDRLYNLGNESGLLPEEQIVRKSSF